MIVKNVLYNGSVQISGILLNLLLMPYVTRVLGKEALGISSFGQAVVGYFVLLGNLGITIYGAKAISERRDDAIERQTKFAECITYQFFFNAFAILLYNAWAFFQGNNIYFLFNLVIFTSMTDLSWVYTGVERFDLIAIRNLIIRVVGTLLIFCFVKNVDDLPLFIVIQQGVLLISNIVFWFELSKIDLHPHFAPITQSLHNIWKPALLLFIPSIFTSIYLSLNKVMLGYLSTISEVAIYDYPNRLVRIAITFIGILGTVMMPRLAYLNKKDDRGEYVTKVKQLCFVSILASVPTMYLLIMLAAPLCNMFFSQEFQGADVVMAFVAPTVISSGLCLYIVCVSLNKVRILTISVAIGSVVNIVLNLLLIPQLAAKGAAISNIVTELWVHCVLIYYLRTVIPVKWLIKNLGIVLFIGAVPFVIFRNISIDINLLFLIGTIGGYVLVYFCLLLLFRYKLIKSILKK